MVFKGSFKVLRRDFRGEKRGSFSRSLGPAPGAGTPSTMYCSACKFRFFWGHLQEMLPGCRGAGMGLKGCAGGERQL